MQSPAIGSKYYEVNFSGRTFQNTLFSEEKQIRNCEQDKIIPKKINVCVKDANL